MGQHQGRLQALPVPQPVDGPEAVGHFSLGRHDSPYPQVGHPPISQPQQIKPSPKSDGRDLEPERRDPQVEQ